MFATSFASFTRPTNTTAYATGDLVANDVDVADVAPMKFSTSQVHGRGAVTQVLIFKGNQVVTNANFTLHLFSTEPEVSNGDNGALAVTTMEGYLGSAELDCTTGGLVSTADAAKQIEIVPIPFDLTHISPGERRLYGLLEAIAAYTPASEEQFKITLAFIGA